MVLGIGPELRCYQCNSLTQPHCADYFDNRTFPLVACPNDGRNYSRCVKMIQESEYTSLVVFILVHPNWICIP